MSGDELDLDGILRIAENESAWAASVTVSLVAEVRRLRAEASEAYDRGYRDSVTDNS